MVKFMYSLNGCIHIKVYMTQNGKWLLYVVYGIPYVGIPGLDMGCGTLRAGVSSSSNIGKKAGLPELVLLQMRRQTSASG
jgi:hypothetical protein